MDGSPRQRGLRLVQHLGAHPAAIPRYLRHFRSGPLAIGVPWFSWPAIDYLDQCDLKQKSVFEFGSGGSTIFFSARAAFVMSVESDERWLRSLEGEIVRRQAGNIELHHRVLSAAPDFAASDYVTLLDRPFDVIVVDCPEAPAKTRRREAFARAEAHVRPGGMIILDDAWRYDAAPIPNRARTIRKFAGTGPGRPGITRTDIYLY
jgi:predicted O-methyltransferase YrrM